jgi:hypothetical protein
MKFAVGDLVQAGSFGMSVWVCRCPTARANSWHLQKKITGKQTYLTRTARENELRLIARAPKYTNGQIIAYEGSKATVLHDDGDTVSIVIGVTRHDVSKSELVLARL